MQVQTVTGPVDLDELGVTLPHEHFAYGLCGWENDSTVARPEREQVRANCVAQACAAGERGIRTIVDLTPLEAGRDAALLRDVSIGSGVQVLCATGLHSLRPVPYFGRRTADEIAELFVAELTVGIADTGVRPALIKLGQGELTLSEYERKCLAAAATAHEVTGAPIVVHVEEGGGAASAATLIGAGVPGGKIMLAHADMTDDIDYHVRMLDDYNVYLGFDRFGHERMQTDARRRELVMELIGRGYVHRLLLSQDYPVILYGRESMSYQDDIAVRNWSLTHLADTVYPQLINAGLSAEDYLALNQRNIARYLNTVYAA